MMSNQIPVSLERLLTTQLRSANAWATIFDGNPLVSVIGCHLRLEILLHEVVADWQVAQGAIDIQRMGFERVARISVAFGLVEKPLLQPLLRVNKMRNRLAHNRDATVTSEDVSGLARDCKAGGIALDISTVENHMGPHHVFAMLTLAVFFRVDGYNFRRMVDAGRMVSSLSKEEFAEHARRFAEELVPAVQERDVRRDSPGNDYY